MDMNRLDLVRAAQDWMTLANSGNRGLMDRRTRETQMFQYAIYMAKPVVPPNSILVKPTRKNPAAFSTEIDMPFLYGSYMKLRKAAATS